MATDAAKAIDQKIESVTDESGDAPQNLPVPSPGQVEEQADQLIKRYAMFGTATGLIPTFGLDVAALTAVQVKMIKDLSELYGYDMNDQMVRTTLTTGVTALAGRLITGIATTLTKTFSPLKFLIGGATQAALSGFLTLEVGKIYQARLSSGENPSDIGVSEIVNHVIAQVQEGKFNPTAVGGFKGKFGFLFDSKK